LLVVEDEALIAMALANDLSKLGWDVVGPAASVDEARELLAVSRPDVAVLDINLAGEMVYPVADWLRNHGIPFVFCSGYEQLEPEGDYDHCPRVRKPVDIRLLDSELLKVRRAA
jgi:DNA-binding response OmpR family regulator